MKYTQEQVEQFFTDHGCKLLSEYVNVKTPIEYIGVCGHVARAARFEVARRPTCSLKCARCSPKITYTGDELRDYVEQEGCSLLAITKEQHEQNKRWYKTIHIVCTCGHEHKLTFAKFCQGEGRVCPACARPKGGRHPHWNPNLTDEERIANRDTFENIKWRESVYQRDNYACQVCGDSRGGNLAAHHLNGYADYPDKRFDISNGVTLCEACHKAFHSVYGYGHNTKDQFDEWTKRDNTEVTAETKASAAP